MDENVKIKFDILDTHIWALTRGNRFLYFNIEKLSKNEIKWFINQKFYKELGYFPNIDSPKSYNEKIQWYKLNYKNSLMTKYADKFLFKTQIEKELGSGYTIPLLGVWSNASDIDFYKLPKSFVLKVNHGGGGKTGIKIIKDKNKENLDDIRLIFDNWVQKWNSAYYSTLDWAYKDIEPLIIAEEYKEEIDGQLHDYKFWCFNGNPKYFWIDKDRYKEHTRDLYDINKNILPVDFIYPRSKKISETGINEFFPSKFDEMLEIAKQLCKPFPHVRVDFYEIDNKVYIGELTFYTESGFGKFFQREWDYKIGEEFILPE